jgi:hypothetical protein
MAKKQETAAVSTSGEIVEELHVVADDEVSYTDVSGKDDLPEGVADIDVGEEATPALPKVKPAKPAAAAVDDDIPAELKGKTPAELARMYREAQSVIGRQGSELGDLRRTADDYIKAKLRSDTAAAAPKVEPAKEPDDVDFFTNPKDAISRIIAEHPALKTLEGAAREAAASNIQRQRAEAEVQFNTAHPDATQVLADPEFRAWVVKSPLRQQMLVRAHKHYDLQSANEVFNTWKELKAARTPAPTPKPTAQRAAGKEAARVPTGGNAGQRTGEAKPGEKIYRRADIIRMMETDPDRYALMGDEITKAYQEGRVR